MGWTYFHKPSHVSSVEAIKNEMGREWCEKHFIAASASIEAVFIVAEMHSPDDSVYVPDADGNVRALLVFKINHCKDHYNFGYKDMSEAMGPCGCEAPRSIIEQASPLCELVGEPDGYSGLKSAIEYRARSFRAAAQKGLKRSLKPGDKVTLREPLSFGGINLQRFTVERCRVRGRRGLSTVFRADNGMLCGVTARNLEGCTVA